jgi:hypothetical protein
MPEKTKEYPIGQRNEGDRQLVCVECGRIWGFDDVIVPDGMKSVEAKEGDAVGTCPWCQDQEGKVSLVHYADEVLTTQTEPPEAA